MDYLKIRRGYASALYEKVISSTGTPISLLDIGTGPGTVVLGLQSHVSEAIGIDSDPEMIGEASRLADEKIRFFCKSIQDFQLEKQFDLVTIAQGLEHMPVSSYKNISRYVRPGGALAIFWKYPDVTTPVSKIFAEALRPREYMKDRLHAYDLTTHFGPFQLSLETYAEFKSEEIYKAEDWLSSLDITETEKDTLRVKTPKYVTEAFINYLWLFRKA
ncbi:MAG: class I SAM-dependent methyltransferase [Bacteriovoracaceae bacterium]